MLHGGAGTSAYDVGPVLGNGNVCREHDATSAITACVVQEIDAEMAVPSQREVYIQMARAMPVCERVQPMYYA